MIFKRKKKDLSKRIVIVSGLPRSGTSLMMKMLEAGGVSPLTDEIRTADQDNPKGYYEYERVKKLSEGDVGWLPQARGKAVKIIAALLTKLPFGYKYEVIFMRREIKEILASQRQMLIRRGEDPDKVSDKEMQHLFETHLLQVLGWIKQQKNLNFLEISYNGIMKDATPLIGKINKFLGGELDTAAMSAVVDPKLYRQRKGK